MIGGSGLGLADRSVLALAKAGRVEAHGIAISPGETAAFGLVGSRPVLILPGRIDAALAVWLVRNANSSRSRRAPSGSLSSTLWNRVRVMRMTEA